LAQLISHKFVRNFTHICRKILQICVKLGKSYLVRLGRGASNHRNSRSYARGSMFENIDYRDYLRYTIVFLRHTYLGKTVSYFTRAAGKIMYVHIMSHGILNALAPLLKLAL
jgi:hypothetical protein